MSSIPEEEVPDSQQSIAILIAWKIRFQVAFILGRLTGSDEHSCDSESIVLRTALQKDLLGKDDLVMNGERDDDQYPVDGTLDIESRTQRDE